MQLQFRETITACKAVSFEDVVQGQDSRKSIGLRRSVLVHAEANKALYPREIDSIFRLTSSIHLLVDW